MQYTLTNISRSTDNQAMKFGQLIQYNIKNVFLEKSHTKCDGETMPDPFLKNQNWAYIWINSVKFYTVCFYCKSSWRLSKYIETKLQTTCFYLIQSFFINHKVWNSFSAWFLSKNIYLVILCYQTKFHCLIAFTSWDIGQYMYCNYLFPRPWHHKFWN